ncbi:hypothetical protein T09_7248 [Trichinella sp. T9]|nr:hypothetical protein T09_7248 [Trichinella sp. T9]
MSEIFFTHQRHSVNYVFCLINFVSIHSEKSENADHTRQIEDDTKQIADDTKQIEDDTKQIEDHTKQNKRRQSSWDPNSVGLGLGYFERFNFVPFP